jgi:hypothetical protein
MRIRKDLAAGLVVLLAATALGCGKRDAAGSSAASAKGAERESDQSREARFDKHAQEQIASSQAFEARKWLKTPKHVIFKHAKGQVAQLVDEFYQAGASQVYVAGVEEHEGSQFGTMLIVALPSDAAARKKIFAIAKQAEDLFQNDPTSDAKQKYLLFSLD